MLEYYCTVHNNNMNQEGYKHIEVLDTVIFYPEHVEGLNALMESGKAEIEVVPLKWGEDSGRWTLPDNYDSSSKTNVRMWPSSLPESIAKISDEHLAKLGNIQCWTEADVRDNRTAQFMLNQTQDADGVVTCWTEIPDIVLNGWIKKGDMKSIICWTHEFEHRMNVAMAEKAGIHVDSIPDYGTDSVSELNIGGMIELMIRNKSRDIPAFTEDDFVIGTIGELFKRFRKFLANEKATRRGRFSHHFHKLGRSAETYGELISGNRKPEELIPEQLLKGKKITILSNLPGKVRLEKVLKEGFQMQVVPTRNMFDCHDDGFFICDTVEEPIWLDLLPKGHIIDVSGLKHIEESLEGKTFGIVGMGRIGTRTAEIADSLGMKVQYYSPNTFNPRFDWVKLEELFEDSDVISVNVAPHKAHGLVSKELIGKMRTGAYFLNTSDGNAVEQDALNLRLQAGSINAMLDVYPGLPTGKILGISDDARAKIGRNLWQHVLCYRAGWKTVESIREKTWKLIEKLAKGLE